MSNNFLSLTAELERERDKIREIALDSGLDFFEVIYEMVDFQQMNEIAAYMGFPTRYPHWRWGMEYERMRKSYAYGLHRIYEMVINTDPCYAYLLESNELVDQKIVMAHVYGHSDFFKKNFWFGKTNRKMMDEMANHATRVWRIIDRIGTEEVEEFIDTCLSLENLIDRHAPYREKVPALGKEDHDEQEDIEVEMRHATAAKLRVDRSYMDSFINPPDVLKEEAEKRKKELRQQSESFPKEPQRDVLLFLLENAQLERWQQDLLEMIRHEAYYFAPQGMTKVMNEGWACVIAGSLLYTEQGLRPIEKIVNQRTALLVSDGEQLRQVVDFAKFQEKETIWIRTTQGFELEGSTTHRLLLPTGSWRRLDELQVGDSVRLGTGCGLWAKEEVPIDWQIEYRLTLPEIATQTGVELESVIRYRSGMDGKYSQKLAAPAQITMMQNKGLNIPTVVDENLAAFLGYLIGYGQMSEKKPIIELTCADPEQADRFVELAKSLFELQPHKKWAPNRWRVQLYSRKLEDFLKHLGLKTGLASRIKEVPDVILCSPKPVVAAFLRAYFDCDAYVGQQGIILSTFSEALGKTIQLLLLNFGILSSRSQQKDSAWHVHITGKSAKIYLEEIGFVLSRKQEALAKYIEERKFFQPQMWEDQIVAIEQRQADVYDISVEGTHRYAAQGFINHNSYWHSTIMTKTGVMTDAEVVDYADHHSGTVAMSAQRINPYKIGLELFRDIEDRWNRGRFGREWDECDDARLRREWDKQTGLGRDKIFEVRRIYNDVGFIDTFFTEDFCNRNQLFTYHYNERTGRYEIETREFQSIKQKLLFSLTNFGQPHIYVIDANYENRGALLLEHNYQGIELKLDEARDTLQNLYKIWKRPVYIKTVIDDSPRLLSFNGREHATRRIK